MLQKSCLFVLFLAVMGSTQAQKKPAAVNAIMGNTGLETSASETRTSPKGGFTEADAKIVFRIQVPEGGANGAAIAFHPKEKLYYASQAGNKEFPIVLFNEAGEIVSSEQKTQADTRGLWYNPRSRQLEGNAYKDGGWFSYELNREGFPATIKITREGRNQPDDHSPGILNTEENEVLFLSGMEFISYNTSGSPLNKKFTLKIQSKNEADYSEITQTFFEENYNYRSFIYTGRKGQEIGLLNINRKRVELYDIKTGYMTKTVSLPLDFKPESFFNFTYANNTYFIFNKETRQWVGFREK